MKVESLVGSLLVGMLVLSSGCGGPGMQIVKQATPNPLLNVKSYALAPLTWEGLTFNGKPEAEWLAGRTPEQQSGWANDKVVATGKMLERFQIEKQDDEQVVAAPPQPVPGQFVLAINVHAYNDGMFAWTLQVRDGNGQVIDEVEGPPRGGGFGIAMELNALRVLAPVDTLKYLRSRYEQ